ncbi:lipid droplet-regulating VLDL assembly factor AUP1 [Erpetoichthys calabaricus]|uniref:AUP1 lipid droplet regulating VLDL assembly factor n=1 Tax=Erpetoichthys calabaricus TaxID=27687 RepID=A0A8C4SYJ3_ERPCA|nr:lipid droplet-regulating VLDL assembly factor AUP1 [Erpetoichthys calabaricus]
MASPGMEQLFDFQRLPKDPLNLILLLLYAPVGLCLMLLRVFIGVHVFLVSCALPDSPIRRFIVRVMCSVLGMFVKENNPHLRDKNVKVYICNHVTQFDHNIVNLITSCNTPMLDCPPGFICWARGFMETGIPSSRLELTEFLRQYCSMQGSLPLLLFPEEDTTNGKAGLLKFSSWPFAVTNTVQPIALLVRRPFIPANIEESSWILELLWTFFIPFTVYQVRWLPPLSRQDEDSSEVFANKVQELLAKELQLVTTQITRADKAEHLKRKRHVAPHVNSSQTLSTASSTISPGFLGANSFADDAKIAAMAKRVSEVLPDVPLSIIKYDLKKTHCIDTTITNLLEKAEEMPSGSGGASDLLSSSIRATTSGSTPALKPVSNTFEKSPIDRHLSLQERKEALYEYARRRYLEKHGPNQHSCQ